MSTDSFTFEGLNAERRTLSAGGLSRRAPGSLLLGPPSRLTLSITPMIDVVFLLLVYFLLATDFRSGEEIYRMDLPDRSGELSRDPFRLDEEPLRIHVDTTDARDASSSGYTLRLEGSYPQPTSFESLFEFLNSNRSESGSGLGLFAADHPIIIHSSPHTLWEHAVEAFNSAARAHYTNVTFEQRGARSEE